MARKFGLFAGSMAAVFVALAFVRADVPGDKASAASAYDYDIPGSGARANSAGGLNSPPVTQGTTSPPAFKTPVNPPPPKSGNPSPGFVGPMKPGTSDKDPHPVLPIKAEKPQKIDLPQSAVGGGRPLVKQRSEPDGLKVAQFDMPENNVVGQVFWSASGDALFILTKDAVVMRIVRTTDNFVVDRTLDLGRRASCLALSASGLIVALNDLQEAWVLDPVTLDVKKRISSPGINRVVSSPEMKFALGLTIRARSGINDPSIAVYLDLQAGIPVHQQQVPTNLAQLSPDGTRYFANDGYTSFESFRLVDRKLVSVQSNGIADSAKSISISPDNKMVCIPSGPGNSGAGTHYSTFIFPLDNIQRPLTTLESGAYPQCVGFDPASHLIFTQNANFPLMVYTDTGIKKGEYRLGTNRDSGPGLRVSQMAVHPAGKKLLLVGNEVRFVELP